MTSRSAATPAAFGSSSDIEAERTARILMSRVAEPGDPDAGRLIREHSARRLIERLRDGRLHPDKATAWAERLRAVDLDAMLHTAARVGAHFAMPGDASWPTALADLDLLDDAPGERRTGAPFGLWVRGPLPLDRLGDGAVAVVGARASTDYGDHVAGAIAAGCATAGRVVVSGGAFGIDAAAHRSVLAVEGATLAVLASGIDRLYPAGNSGLLDDIAAAGLLLSEAAPGCAPSRSRFLVRNRLIAGLTAGTVVVEAALRSGSLNTARWARDLGRALMGVPGPVTSMMSAGVHELLRQPETVLVTDADEVLEMVSPIGTSMAPPKRGDVRARDELSDLLRRVLDAVPKVAPAGAGAIAALACLPAAAAQASLVDLARRGLVIRVAQAWRLPPDGPDAP